MYSFYYPKNYHDLIENIGYSLKRIDKNLEKKQFRNKCSEQSLRICIKLINKGNNLSDSRIELLFRLILKYHKYWA
jgi:hypothetical protein